MAELATYDHADREVARAPFEVLGVDNRAATA
jgi:hypothetical protein